MCRGFLIRQRHDETHDRDATGGVHSRDAVVHSGDWKAAHVEAARIGVVTQERARSARRSLARDWPDLVLVPVTGALVERAETLAWDHALRGYDALQLASALTWQEAVGTEIVLASFDRQLWEATPKAGLKAWPDRLPG